MIIANLWCRLNCLVPDPDCRTFGDEYNDVLWLDVRAMPTEIQLQAVTEAEMIESAATSEITSLVDLDKVFKLLFQLNFDQENRLRVLESKPEITQPTYKQAIIDAYKAL